MHVGGGTAAVVAIATVDGGVCGGVIVVAVGTVETAVDGDIDDVNCGSCLPGVTIYPCIDGTCPNCI